MCWKTTFNSEVVFERFGLPQWWCNATGWWFQGLSFFGFRSKAFLLYEMMYVTKWCVTSLAHKLLNVFCFLITHGKHHFFLIKRNCQYICSFWVFFFLLQNQLGSSLPTKMLLGTCFCVNKFPAWKCKCEIWQVQAASTDASGPIRNRLYALCNLCPAERRAYKPECCVVLLSSLETDVACAQWCPRSLCKTWDLCQDKWGVAFLQHRCL